MPLALSGGKRARAVAVVGSTMDQKCGKEKKWLSFNCVYKRILAYLLGCG